MKKNYSIKQTLILGGFLTSGFLSAQIQLNQLTEFATSIYDINDEGKAVMGNGYYDFGTNTLSPTEEGVLQTVSITNSGMVLGQIIDDSGENFLPAIKNGDTWTALENMDENFTYTLYDISDNGIYVVGQTDWTEENGAWGFIYNTETQTFKLLSSPLYEYGAAYGVSNAGIAVGWVDDLESGTVRMPAYFDEEGNITLISELYGEASNINENNEIVGVLESAPFIYNIATNTITTYETPDGYYTSSFADISDNGIAVGYADTYIEGQGDLRNPIIYHASLGAQPRFLAEVLTENGVDASTLDGTAYKISSNGKYVGGWISGPAFMATGWAIFFDDAILNVSDLNNLKLTAYPNPVKDVLNFNSDKNILNISVYNLAGQQIISNAKLTNKQLNLASLVPGTYIFCVTLEGGKTETLKVIKK